MIWQLYTTGVAIFRCNFAHENPKSALSIVEVVRELEKEKNVKIPLLIDVEGPGIRTGPLSSPILYHQGDVFKLFTVAHLQEEKSLNCDYELLGQDVHIGSIIKIDAGLFRVQVKEITATYLLVQAQNDFCVGSRRHINLPGVHVQLPSFTEKDKRDVLFAIEQKFSYVALSFVRSSEDMIQLRKFLQDHG
jgi:pyruvate kinase